MEVVKTGVTKAPDRKILSISSQRQITIPLKFYQALGFGSEAECIISGDRLIVRPIQNATSGEFAEQILSDLVKEGLSGEELLSEFKTRQAQVRDAAKAMLKNAEDIATGKAEYYTYDDVFGTEE
jgi:bifunctional DNA-binding transcriptional regulator/antitoxin component of YhaV-PrlF toxin-antitoxin module